MARIREYESEVPAAGAPPSRRASASDFGGGGGLLAAGQALGEIADSMHTEKVRREVGDAEVAVDERVANWTVEFQKRAQAAPAGDTSYVDQFITDFQNDAQKVREGLGTREANRRLDERIARTSAYFRQQAGTMAIRGAGEKAVQDYQAGLNAKRNTVLADPGQFPLVLDDALAALMAEDSPYARMPAAARERLARETAEGLALSTVQGIIERDPEQALQRLNASEWSRYLDADKTVALKARAETAIEGRRIDAARAEVAAERELRKVREKTADDFLKRLASDELTADQVLKSNLAPFGEGSKSTFLNLLKKGDAPDRDSRTYGPAFVDMFRRVTLPDGDPAKITDEAALYRPLEAGEITYSGIQALRAEMQGRRSMEGNVESELKKRMLDTAQSALTATDPILRIRDPKGDEKLQSFMAWFLPEYQRQRAAGKTALQLLDPESADYLGKGLGQFRRSRADMMRDIMQDNPGNPNVPAVPVDGKPADAPPAYKNKDDVVSAYRAGKLKRDEAQKILRDNGWAR